MNEFIKKNFKIVSLLIIILLFGAIGLTFAYTMNNINIAIGTGEYNVIYNGSSTLPSSSLYPIYDSELLNDENSDKIIKINFTVKGAQGNPTDKNIIYDVSLTDLELPKELKSEYLKWSLHKDGGEIYSGNFSTDFDIQTDNRIVLTDIQQDLPKYTETAHSYTFYIWLSEKCVGNITSCTIEDDMSELANKTLSGKIRIELSTQTKKPLERTGILDILEKYGFTVKTDKPDFSKTSCLEKCEESTVGLYKTEDDLGTSYYFRGDVENNYVKFGKWKTDWESNESYGAKTGDDMYWRIIRINGDGTIRMIYSGTKPWTNGMYTANKSIGTMAFNTIHTDNTYVGYMNSSVNSSSYELTHTNTNDSSIKDYLENTWYANNFRGTEYEQYISDAIYCNDREVAIDEVNYGGNGSGQTNSAYKGRERLYTNKAPSLICSQVNDRFTYDSNNFGIETNGMLDAPIGLITADEVAFAGGVYGKSNESNYLHSGDSYWTMTPFAAYNANASGFISFTDHEYEVFSYVSTNARIRPVITLKYDAIKSGDGSAEKPFVVTEDQTNVSYETLVMLGLEDELKEGNPNFTVSATTNEGIYKTNDDLGISYYFRGAVNNNYVNFAGYYWRIIRINGDGTIRMIYDGMQAYNNGVSNKDRIVTTGVYNSLMDDNAYLGYMYGSLRASTYQATHANTNNSVIKDYLENTWYENNIKDTKYEQYIADAIYCNDREVSTSVAGYSNSTGIGTTNSAYKPNERLYTNKTPSLVCAQANDRFTYDNNNFEIETNGMLDAPIGLITADEVAMAGGVYGTANTANYLYSGTEYWTMSPFAIYNSKASGFPSAGSSSAFSNVTNSKGIKPVITLKIGVIKYGDGSIEEPFRVE